MLKIILLVTLLIIIVSMGLFLWFRDPKIEFQNPIGHDLGEILGFINDTPPGKKTDNLLTQTKETFEKNAKESIDTVKTTIINVAKTTLDNVSDEQTRSDKVVSVNTLGITTNPDIDKQMYVIDLAQNNDLKLSLVINKKYYLKLQNTPLNYCLYISSEKFPIIDGIVEIQFIQSGNYKVKANSCNLNDKNIGTLTVQ